MKWPWEKWAENQRQIKRTLSALEAAHALLISQQKGWREAVQLNMENAALNHHLLAQMNIYAAALDDVSMRGDQRSRDIVNKAAHSAKNLIH